MGPLHYSASQASVGGRMTGQLGLERVRDWQRFCHRQVGSRHAMPASQDLMQRGYLIRITRPHLSLRMASSAQETLHSYTTAMMPVSFVNKVASAADASSEAERTTSTLTRLLQKCPSSSSAFFHTALKDAQQH